MTEEEVLELLPGDLIYENVNDRAIMVFQRPFKDGVSGLACIYAVEGWGQVLRYRTPEFDRLNLYKSITALNFAFNSFESTMKDENSRLLLMAQLLGRGVQRLKDTK